MRLGMPMNFLNKLFLRFLTTLLLLSFLNGCQRELSFDVISPESEGTLQKDNRGNCQTFVVNGNFTKGVDIATTNSLEVKVVVIRKGTYFIHSNEVDGFSF